VKTSTALLILLNCSLASLLTQRYKKYDLVELCGRHREKTSLEMGGVAHQFILNGTHRNIINCHLELELPSKIFGFAVFIESMKLDTTNGCKKDFLQFGRDFLFLTSHKSKKKCGTIPAAGEPGRMSREDRRRREYIETTDKEMDVWISVRPPLQGQESKELKLIVTPFKKSCSSEDNYYRKCPGTNRCIRQELFCDGIVNCDGQPDEQEDSCLNSSLGNVDVFPSIPIIILIVVFGIVALMIIIFLVRWVSLILKGRRPEPGPEGERRALRDLSPTAPSRGVEDPSLCLPNPSSSPVPPNPPSYSEVMGGGGQYKDDPPKYSEYPTEHPLHQVIGKD